MTLHPNVVRKKVALYNKKIQEAQQKIRDYQQLYCGHEDLQFVSKITFYGVPKTAFEHVCRDCNSSIVLPKKQQRI